MRLLPSEKAVAIEQAIKQFNEFEELYIYEPCDCGSQIRHNNGGNYHDSLSLKRDEGRVYLKRETTCELTPDAEWELCEDWEKVIRVNGDWL